ncbi:carboxymuconolactone decarboxylase family protein [Nitrospinota bacterium]
MEHSELYKKGLETRAKVFGDKGEERRKWFTEIEPDIARYVTEFVFGEIYNRPHMDPKTREKCILASHISLGRRAEVDHHVRAALNVGCTKEEILEVFILMSVYAGFSAMHGALEEARAAFEDYGLVPKRSAK